jgi:hypothetical protein
MPLLSPALSLATMLATPVAAPVTDATVYSDRARVTRTSTLTVTDRAEVEFPPLPVGVDADSVRLEASGGAVVETIQIRPVGDEPLPADEARAVLKEIEEADDRIAELEREKALLTELAGVTAWRPAAEGEESEDEPIGGGKRLAAARGKLDPRGWKQGMAFLTSFAEGMQARRAAVEGKLLDVREHRQALRARARLLALGPPARALRVTATLTGQGPTTLRLRYDVGGARWTPKYEVRLDAERERVTVALSGMVSQSTGEDWEGARLVLSTAVPFAAPAPPALAAWRIGERERFIPTPRGVETAAPPPEAPPLLALQSDEAQLRQALLRSAGVPEAPPRPEAAEERPGGTEAAVVTVPTTGPAGVTPAPPIGAGQLVGNVFDQTGTPIKGVKITVSGGGGRLSRYTNEEGVVRFNGLGRGVYDVTANAPKLKQVLQRGVAVREGEGAEVNLVMEVESSGVEEVTVLEKTPVVSTTSANVKEVYDLDFVESLPSSSRDVVHRQMVDEVASAGRGRVRGGAGAQTVFSQDGFDLSGDLGPLQGSAAYEVATAGYGRAGREHVGLAPPPAYRRPRLAANAPAILGGGHDLAFPAAAAETVRSGTGDRRVALASWGWQVSVERNVYPALADRAFLVATLASPEARVLPGGPAALYVGGDAVGTATLKLVAPGERFSLPLGEDPALRPVRQVTVETREQGLVWKDELSRYTVTTELVNPHPVAVRVRLHDQIPVSPDRTVEVRLLESAPGATLDAATGEVSWSLVLPPGGTTTVKLVYSLKRPKGHRLYQ